MRFHANRSSISVGRSLGGLPPDSLIENEAAILKGTQHVIERYHDDSHGSMLRFVVAPASRELMKQFAAPDRNFKVSMHTHLAENDSDIRYSREKFSMTPAQYVEDPGWAGPDVWHAYCVKLD